MAARRLADLVVPAYLRSSHDLEEKANTTLGARGHDHRASVEEHAPGVVADHGPGAALPWQFERAGDLFVDMDPVSLDGLVASPRPHSKFVSTADSSTSQTSTSDRSGQETPHMTERLANMLMETRRAAALYPDGGGAVYATELSKGAKTTVILQCIACQHCEATVSAALDDLGLAGTYNAVHVPRGRHNKNLGHAFVNFKTPAAAAVCFIRCDGSQLGGFGTHRICRVSYSKHQGAEFLLGRMVEAMQAQVERQR